MKTYLIRTRVNPKMTRFSEREKPRLWPDEELLGEVKFSTGPWELTQESERCTGCGFVGVKRVASRVISSCPEGQEHLVNGRLTTYRYTCCANDSALPRAGDYTAWSFAA